jgi:mannose-6-phosphate isomerase-like protein (cupin superfamily)
MDTALEENRHIAHPAILRMKPTHAEAEQSPQFARRIRQKDSIEESRKDSEASNPPEGAIRAFMEPMDVGLKAQELSGKYENVVLSQTNDHVVRISRMTEPYFWHLHPDSDETFLGIEGVLIVELENQELEHQRIELRPGQMITVPKGTRHRTSPAGSHSVNLTFERAGIETVRTDPPSL